MFSHYTKAKKKQGISNDSQVKHVLKDVREVTLVKLGGSVITKKSQPYVIRKRIIRQLLEEVRDARVPVILAHGQGSFAHTSAKANGGTKGYASKTSLATVSYDVMQLNTLLIQEAIELHIPAILFRPMNLLQTDRGMVTTHQLSLLTRVLAQDFLPILCGDIVWDSSWKSTIFSGEQVLAEVAQYFHKEGIIVRQVIFVGETDGFYNAANQTIPLITPATWEKYKQYVKAPKGVDVTGGMAHKVEQALSFAKQKIPTVLINGKRKHELYKQLIGLQTRSTSIY